MKHWSPDIEHTEAFLIIGVNPRRPFDDEYEIWIDQVQTQVSGYLGEVKALEKEWEQVIAEKLEDANRRRASELSAELVRLEHDLRQTEQWGLLKWI